MSWLEYIKEKERKKDWVTPAEVARMVGINRKKAIRLAEYFAESNGRTIYDYAVFTGPTSHIFLLPPSFIDFVKRTERSIRGKTQVFKVKEVA